MKKILALLLTLSAFINANEKPFVTTDLKNGQLGNQLFQIATVLAYAWDYDADALFPDLNSDRARLSLNRDRIFFRLNAENLPRPTSNTYQESSWHGSTLVPFQPDQFLKGYFQSWNHFHKYRERILETFSPSPSNLEKLLVKYSHLIDNPKTVCVNVRTFTANQSNCKKWPFLGLEYYRKAFELFSNDCLFVVFSDRIEWCKHHFAQFSKNFVFIEGNDAIDDLSLMSMMQDHIIANSTLAWWGAYLNPKPNKVVVAPQNWTHPDIETFPGPHPNEFYFPDWVTIPNDFNTPYPEDMRAYDVCSQSDDGDRD